MKINEIADYVIEAVVERMDPEAIAEKIFYEQGDYIEKVLTEKISEAVYEEIQIQIENGNIPF